MATMPIPIRYDIDLCIVGASSGAVAAAVRAAGAGKRVVVLGERPYLGDDLCATFRLKLEADDAPRTALAQALFGADGRRRPTPQQAKIIFDRQLLDAGVPFLFGCYPVALLTAGGRACGAVLACRNGLFAVRAGSVVDATWRGQLARLAGLPFVPFQAQTVLAERVVIGGAAHAGAGISVETDEEPVAIPTQDGQACFPVHRYRLELPMADANPAAFAVAESLAEALTFDPEQSRTSDSLWMLPPDPLAPGARRADVWHDGASLECFRTAVPGLWLFGAAADLSREAAASLVRPGAFLLAGERLGEALAAEAAPAPAGAMSIVMSGAEPITTGDIRISHDPLRTAGQPTLDFPLDRAPVLGAVDVLVVGGGTGGAPAGIAAARQGARTLVCEYQPTLGGVMTVGMIATYYFGNRVGFTEEIDSGTRAMGPAALLPPTGMWRIEWKQRWFRQANEQAGAAVWTGSLAYGAVVDGCRVCGALLATPYGCGVVTAGVVVDASGNADLAAHAGAAVTAIGSEHLAVQGAGLGPRQLGCENRNTDWTFIDDTDTDDWTQVMVVARTKYPDEFDTSTMADTRERRRILGDITLTPIDMMVGRRFHDTVVVAHSNFDTHGFTVHPLFQALPMDEAGVDAEVPFRCLLPRDLDGVIVTGLGKSAHRDAMPVIRMQPDVQNEGYAAGVAAAWAAREGGDLRALDITALQRHLAEVGILPATLPGQAESAEPSPADIDAAISRGLADHAGLAAIFAQPAEAVNRLGAAFAAEEDPARCLRLAQLLGLLGDDRGAALLAVAIADTPWDGGWNFYGMGQYGRSQSPLDDLICALAGSGARQHAAVIMAKLRVLTPAQAFSHHRAIAEACERLHLTEAAPLLAALLAQPGMRGHHQHDIAAAAAETPADPTDCTLRNASLRELHLARALLRLGDHQARGHAILTAYATDLRALYARHAQRVLAETAVPVG